MKTLRNALGWLADEPRQLTGVRILQVAIGLMLLFRVFTEIPFASYLWGPRSIANGSTVALFGLVPGALLDTAFATDAGVRLVLGLMGAAALALVLGLRTRLATGVAWLTFMMLNLRLPSLGDGGDNIVQLVLVYMLFLIPAGQARARGSLAVWLHNVAVIAIGAQLVVLYLTSGFLKTHGSVWQNGTALYMIGQVEWFSLPALRGMFKDPYVVTLATYSSMMFQVWFPVAIFSRMKLPWILMGICFHLGIATFMGLITFSTVMIGMELFLITDGEYGRMRQRAAELRGRLARFLFPQVEAEPRMLLFIDGFCPKCRAVGRALGKMDRRGALRVSSFRHGDEYAAHGITAEALERRMHVVDLTTGEVRAGFAAARALASLILYLYPLRPLLAALDLAGLGERLYDALASRRLIVPDPALCGASCNADFDAPAVAEAVREG
ncbi:MAG TPA: DCC1-like thiol-disulfide oxidoreductase family protein [Pyrinomonadaceae bacterium]|nr:DCC1-like thiol-disulfide oxidoreductase family protein [Pyrinomonadaceae bacterium]